MEKANGVPCREKFRLRLYDGDTGYIRLEKKIKVNGLCAKTSAALSKAETELLLAGSLEWMRGRGDALLGELYAKMRGAVLRPRTLVEYIREPFVFPSGNVRVTLDLDIRTGLGCTRFLDPAPPMISVFGCAVLEVKYDGFLPDIVFHAVQTPNRRQTAFSKYAVCRQYD